MFLRRLECSQRHCGDFVHPKEYSSQNPEQSERRTRLGLGPEYLWGNDAPLLRESAREGLPFIVHNNSFNKHSLNTYSMPSTISMVRKQEIITK